MPGKRAPKSALLGEVDVSSLVGQVVANVEDSGNWTLSSDLPVRYRTIRHLSNGHGERLWTLEYGASVNADRGASTWAFGVDAVTDLFYVASTGASAEAFTVSANAAYGFTSTATAVLQSDGSYRADAQADWIRDTIEDVRLTITRTGSATAFVVPRNTVEWSDTPIHRLRRRGTIADADDVYSGETLEDDDPTFSVDGDAVHYGERPTGKLWRQYQTTAGTYTLKFPDTTAGRAFANALGFDVGTGDGAWEDVGGTDHWVPTEYTSNGATYIESDRPPPSVFATNNSLKRWLPGRVNQGGSSVSAGGVVTGIVTGQHSPWYCVAYYYAPMSSSVNELSIFRPGGWLDHCPPGYPVDVCPELMDPRRGSSDPAQGYSALYTPQDSGRRGRRVCRIQTGTGDLTADYGGGAVEHRGEMELTVVEDGTF